MRCGAVLAVDARRQLGCSHIPGTTKGRQKRKHWKKKASTKHKEKGKSLAGKYYKEALFYWELWEAREVPMEPAGEERQKNICLGDTRVPTWVWSQQPCLVPVYPPNIYLLVFCSSASSIGTSLASRSSHLKNAFFLLAGEPFLISSFFFLLLPDFFSSFFFFFVDFLSIYLFFSSLRSSLVSFDSFSTVFRFLFYHFILFFLIFFRIVFCYLSFADCFIILFMGLLLRLFYHFGLLFIW